MIERTRCNVERTEQQDYHIHWRTSHPGQTVRVYMTTNPDQFYCAKIHDEPVACTTDESVRIANPDKTRRYFFLLEFEHGEAIVLAERSLCIKGAPNFRDLGGYTSSDSRSLKWGKLYRSSKLSTLTPSDIEYVNRLGVTLICDFRQETEMQLEPTVLGENPKQLIAHLPVMPGSSQSFMDSLHNGIIDIEDSATFMQQLNREFVSTQMPRYAQMFKLLLADEHTLLLHCASGKDRTGFGAAILLDVLGVSEDAIVEDYLLTNTYLPLQEELERLSANVKNSKGAVVGQEILRPLLEVRPEYILACFDEIALRYGSRNNFYAKALGLDDEHINRLRDTYLS